MQSMWSIKLELQPEKDYSTGVGGLKVRFDGDDDWYVVERTTAKMVYCFDKEGNSKRKYISEVVNVGPTTKNYK